MKGASNEKHQITSSLLHSFTYDSFRVRNFDDDILLGGRI